MQTKLISIDSRYRTAGSPDNFRVNFSISNELHNVKAIALKEVSFINGLYNVNNNNNTFYYTAGGPLASVTMPIGQYDIDGFIIALNNMLTPVGGAVNQNPLTKKLSITTTTAISYNEYINPRNRNPMAELIGIIDSTPETLNYDCLALPNLSGLKALHIHSNVLASGNSYSARSRGHSSLLDVVPVDVPFGGIISHEGSDADRDLVVFNDDNSSSNTKNLNDIDIQLLDSEGNSVNLNGTHINIILKIYY